MHVRLIQRDHPDPRVNDMAISHRDPYFAACWQAVVHDWTRHLTSRVAALTADGDKHLKFDDFCRQLANGSAARSTRERIVQGAMEEATGRGLGSLTWHDHNELTFCAYRNVPLVPDEELARLTDAELYEHARAIWAVNQRLTATGQPQVGVPEWVREKWPRINAAYRVTPSAGAWRDDGSAKLQPESTTQARLDALREDPTSGRDRQPVSRSTAQTNAREAMQAYLDAFRKGPAFPGHADDTPPVIPPSVEQGISL